MSLDSEKSLEIERKKQEEMQLALRNQEVDRTNLNASVNQAREDLEKFKLKQTEYEVRKESLNEQLVSMDTDFKSIDENSSTKKITLESLSSELEKILRGIDRLGAINLAAEAEFKEESNRMEKLDEQFDDLNRALETLTSAIKQIDDESKSRFSETFEKVNQGLSKHFPRLFDGGKAYLELEDNDALNGGVFVMARPPGKRNSNIHLLSGGEKALTAVALLFSPTAIILSFFTATSAFIRGDPVPSITIPSFNRKSKWPVTCILSLQSQTAIKLVSAGDLNFYTFKSYNREP